MGVSVGVFVAVGVLVGLPITALTLLANVLADWQSGLLLGLSHEVIYWVGIVVSLTSLFVPPLAEISMFALMALVLIFRPQGLFGRAGLLG